MKASWSWIILYMSWTIVGQLEAWPTRKVVEETKLHDLANFKREENGDELITEVVRDSNDDGRNYEKEEYRDSNDGLDFASSSGDGGDRSEEYDFMQEPAIGHDEMPLDNLEKDSRFDKDYSDHESEPSLQLKVNVTSGFDKAPESNIFHLSLGGDTSNDHEEGAASNENFDETQEDFSDRLSDTFSQGEPNSDGTEDSKHRIASEEGKHLISQDSEGADHDIRDQSLGDIHDKTSDEAFDLTEPTLTKHSSGLERGFPKGFKIDALNQVLELLRGTDDLLVQGNFSINVRDAAKGKSLLFLDGKFSSGIKGSSSDGSQKVPIDTKHSSPPCNNSVSQSTMKPTTALIVNNTKLPENRANFSDHTIEQASTPVYTSSSLDYAGRTTNGTYEIVTTSSTEYSHGDVENSSSGPSGHDSITTMSQITEFTKFSETATETSSTKFYANDYNQNVGMTTTKTDEMTIPDDYRVTTPLSDVEDSTNGKKHFPYMNDRTLSPIIEDRQEEEDEPRTSDQTENIVAEETTMLSILESHVSQSTQPAEDQTDISVQTENSVNEKSTISVAQIPHSHESDQSEGGQFQDSSQPQDSAIDTTTVSTIQDDVPRFHEEEKGQTETPAQTEIPVTEPITVPTNQNPHIIQNYQPKNGQMDNPTQLENTVTEVTTVSMLEGHGIPVNDDLELDRMGYPSQTQESATESSTIPENQDHDIPQIHQPEEGRMETFAETDKPGSEMTTELTVQDNHIHQDHELEDIQTENPDQTEKSVMEKTTVPTVQDLHTLDDNLAGERTTEDSNRPQDTVTQMTTVSIINDDLAHHVNGSSGPHTETLSHTEDPVTEATAVPTIQDRHISQSHQPEENQTETPIQTEHPIPETNTQLTIQDHRVPQTNNSEDGQMENSGQTHYPMAEMTTVLTIQSHHISQENQPWEVHEEFPDQTQNPVAEITTVLSVPPSPISQIHSPEDRKIGTTESLMTEVTTLSPSQNRHVPEGEQIGQGQTESIDNQNHSATGTTVPTIRDLHTIEEDESEAEGTDNPDRLQDPVTEITFVSAVQIHHVPQSVQLAKNHTEPLGQTNDSVTDFPTISSTESYRYPTMSNLGGDEREKMNWSEPIGNISKDNTGLPVSTDNYPDEITTVKVTDVTIPADGEELRDLHGVSVVQDSLAMNGSNDHTDTTPMNSLAPVTIEDRNDELKENLVNNNAEDKDSTKTPTDLQIGKDMTTKVSDSAGHGTQDNMINQITIAPLVTSPKPNNQNENSNNRTLGEDIRGPLVEGEMDHLKEVISDVTSEMILASTENIPVTTQKSLVTLPGQPSSTISTPGAIFDASNPGVLHLPEKSGTIVSEDVKNHDIPQTGPPNNVSLTPIFEEPVSHGPVSHGQLPSTISTPDAIFDASNPGILHQPEKSGTIVSEDVKNHDIPQTGPPNNVSLPPILEPVPHGLEAPVNIKGQNPQGHMLPNKPSGNPAVGNLDNKAANSWNNKDNKTLLSSIKGKSPTSTNTISTSAKQPMKSSPVAGKAGGNQVGPGKVPPKNLMNKTEGMIATKKPGITPVQNKQGTRPSVDANKSPKTLNNSSIKTVQNTKKPITSGTVSKKPGPEAKKNSVSAPKANTKNEMQKKAVKNTTTVKPLGAGGKTKPLLTKSTPPPKANKTPAPTKQPTTKKPISSRTTPKSFGNKTKENALKTPEKITPKGKQGIIPTKKPGTSPTKKEGIRLPSSGMSTSARPDVEKPPIKHQSHGGSNLPNVGNAKIESPKPFTGDSEKGATEPGRSSDQVSTLRPETGSPANSSSEVNNNLLLQGQETLSANDEKTTPNVAAEISSTQPSWSVENPEIAPIHHDNQDSTHNNQEHLPLHPEGTFIDSHEESHFNPHKTPPSEYPGQLWNGNQQSIPSTELGHPSHGGIVNNVLPFTPKPNVETNDFNEFPHGGVFSEVPNLDFQNITFDDMKNYVEALQRNISEKIQKSFENFPNNAEPLENLTPGSDMNLVYQDFLKNYQNFMNRTQTDFSANFPDHQNPVPGIHLDPIHQSISDQNHGHVPSIGIDAAPAIGSVTIPKTAQQFFELFWKKLAEQNQTFRKQPLVGIQGHFPTPGLNQNGLISGPQQNDYSNTYSGHSFNN